MPALLTATGLVAGYSAEANVLNGVDLVVEEGEIVTVMGRTAQEVDADEGVAAASYYLARPGESPSAGRTSRPSTRIQCPRRRRLRPTVEQCVQDAHGRGEPRGRAVGIPGRHARPDWHDVRPSFRGSENGAAKSAGTMSGGERQMLAMARASSASPAPAPRRALRGPVASPRRRRLRARSKAINARGVTLLMVEQNARRALGMSTRAYVLDLGRNRYEGKGPSPPRGSSGRSI